MTLSKEQLIKGTKSTKEHEVKEGELEGIVHIRPLSSAEETEIERIRSEAGGSDINPQKVKEVRDEIQKEREEELTEEELEDLVMEKMGDDLTMDVGQMIEQTSQADHRIVAYGLSNEDNGFEMTPEEAGQIKGSVVADLSDAIWEYTKAQNDEEDEEGNE